MTKEGQRTIALLYSHKDREYLQRSGSTKTTVLVDQLSALAESFAGFELWWDDKTLEKFARWVLRAHGLHPQARASSHWEPRL